MALWKSTKYIPSGFNGNLLMCFQTCLKDRVFQARWGTSLSKQFVQEREVLKSFSVALFPCANQFYLTSNTALPWTFTLFR